MTIKEPGETIAREGIEMKGEKEYLVQLTISATAKVSTLAANSAGSLAKNNLSVSNWHSSVDLEVDNVFVNDIVEISGEGGNENG